MEKIKELAKLYPNAVSKIDSDGEPIELDYTIIENQKHCDAMFEKAKI